MTWVGNWKEAGDFGGTTASLVGSAHPLHCPRPRAGTGAPTNPDLNTSCVRLLLSCTARLCPCARWYHTPGTTSTWVQVRPQQGRDPLQPRSLRCTLLASATRLCLPGQVPYCSFLRPGAPWVQPALCPWLCCEEPAWRGPGQGPLARSPWGLQPAWLLCSPTSGLWAGPVPITEEACWSQAQKPRSGLSPEPGCGRTPAPLAGLTGGHASPSVPHGGCSHLPALRTGRACGAQGCRQGKSLPGTQAQMPSPGKRQRSRKC